MHVNQRGYAWLDDRERTEEEEARAAALMNKWSSLRHDEEQRMFRMQSDIEEGVDRGYEPDYCETCGGATCLGLDGRLEVREDIHGGEYEHRNPVRSCSLGDGSEELFGIKCPNPNCEDGYDMGPVRESEQRARVAEAERQLEIELVEDKLARIGARPMRPYEHWNEEEAHIQYMEEGRFGHHSR